MACKSCQERRIRLNRERALKSKRGKVVQAAAIGAVLAVTEAAGRIMGIRDDGEVQEADAGEERTSGGTKRAG